MSRSPSRDICWLFKMLWEEHPKNHGREYIIQGRDMREAKELIHANGRLEEEMVRDRVRRFLESDFEGWVELDYPAWAFFKHFNRYAPPRKVEVAVRGPRPQPQTMSMVIYCSRCETNHRADQACPVKVA